MKQWDTKLKKSWSKWSWLKWNWYIQIHLLQLFVCVYIFEIIPRNIVDMELSNPVKIFQIRPNNLVNVAFHQHDFSLSKTENKNLGTTRTIKNTLWLCYATGYTLLEFPFSQQFLCCVFLTFFLPYFSL